jgi:WD40 repeat protein
MPKGSVHIPGRINDIAYDTSGRILAAAADNGIFLIDAVTRKMTFHLETAKANAAAYKGEDLVIATDSGLEIYNPEFELVNKVDTGSPVHSLEYGHGFIYAGTEQGLMKFTADGEVVFSLSGKNTITDILAAGEHILTAAEQEVRVLKQDGSLVKTLPGAGKLAFSGKTLAAAGKDGIALYNPAWNSLTGSGTDKDKEEGKATAVNTVALSPSGLFLIAGADEGLGIWVSSTGYPIHTIKSRPVSLMAMSRTGEFALVVDDEISFMEAVKEPSGNLVVENNSATAINLLINGRKPEAGAVIEKGGSRTYSGMLIGQYELSAAPLTAQRIRLSQASTTIKEDANSKIYVYQESSAVPILSPGQQFEVLSAVRAGDLLALGFEASRPGPNGTVYGTIHVFKGERLHHNLINGHSNKINAMALDEGRERLFSGGADRLVLLWNLKEAHPVAKTVLHSDEVVRSLSLSGDNSKIAVGAGVITIIDTASNRVLKTLPDGSIAAFSPLANTTIITANKEHLRIYSGRNFTLSRSVVHDAGSEPVFIAYSPNGKTILLGFENNTLREYAADTLDLLYSFQGMTAVYAEDFKITGGIDGMLRVYNNTGRLLSAVKAHDGAITAVSSGAGGLITSSSKDGTARTWKLQDQLTEKGIHVYYHRDKEWLHISGGYYAASDADAGAIHLKNPVQSLFNPARVIESTKN